MSKEIIGIDQPNEIKLKIENMINDSIVPSPRYSIENEIRQNKTLLILKINKGENTPYLYKNKAYIRNDTSTVEVDRNQLMDLLLKGKIIDYEDLQSQKQNLTFNYLEQSLKKTLGISNLNDDIFLTFNLMNNDGVYSVAAELLSDQKNSSYPGVDIVKFESSPNQAFVRETLENMSILELYDRVIEIFKHNYVYEEIINDKREEKQLIPRDAFREAFANGLVHRRWESSRLIQISMFHNKIEIVSPGGLPNDISEDEYLNKRVSSLRNPIIGGIFFRLKIIEKFGTGIDRLIYSYDNYTRQPKFEITENSVSIILPTVVINNHDFSEDELSIVELFSIHDELSRAELEENSGFNKYKVLRIVKEAVTK